MTLHSDAADPLDQRRLSLADPRLRGIIVQALVLAAVVLFGWWVVNNTSDNLARQGIASGFEFLDQTAGFSIVMHLIDYDETSTYSAAFLVGLLNTLLVAAIGVVIATVLGFVVGIGRLSQNWLIARIAGAYVETLRNIPLLLQIFFWYYAVLTALPTPRDSMVWLDTVFLNNRGLYLPSISFETGGSAIAAGFAAAVALSYLVRRWSQLRFAKTGKSTPVLFACLVLLIGLPAIAYFISGSVAVEVPVPGRFNLRGGMVLIPEFMALVIALSVYTAAFIAENVRSGIQSVSKGQSEAAAALGLKPALATRLVIIPQAMRVIIPPLTSQYLNLTKNSSLAAAIAYPDLVSVFGGTVLNQTGQAVEVISITMAVYLLLSLTISLGMNIYNQRKAIVER